MDLLFVSSMKVINFGFSSPLDDKSFCDESASVSETLLSVTAGPFEGPALKYVSSNSESTLTSESSISFHFEARASFR